MKEQTANGQSATAESNGHVRRGARTKRELTSGEKVQVIVRTRDGVLVRAQDGTTYWLADVGE
jgi:hypothetical protein